MTDQSQNAPTVQPQVAPEVQPQHAPTAQSQEPPTHQPELTQTAQPKNLPAATLRDGSLKATIWRNEGQNGAYHSVNLARTYEDSQGNPRDTQSFRAQDMLGLSELTRQAYYRTKDLNREAFKEHRRTEPEPQRDPTRTR